MSENTDLPPPEGGIQFGRYAVIQRLTPDGWKTTVVREWRGSGWHDMKTIAVESKP